MKYIEDKRIFYQQSSQTNDAGFMVRSFNDIKIVHDPYCPPFRAYFITKDSFDFLYLGKSVYPFTKPSPIQEATNYGFSVWQNWVCTMPRLNGVIIADGTKASDLGLPSDCNVADFAHFKDYDYAFKQGDGQGGDKTFGGPEYTGYSGSGIIVDDVEGGN
jgi:hypothetical protein